MSELDPKIGLVTVLYNGKEVLPDFFASLAKQTYKNYVLYVIDNSPNDEALYLAKTLAAEYKIPSEFINNNENLGVAKGNNQGIFLALEQRCENVVLINNDVVFGSGLIEDLLVASRSNCADMVVPKIYYYDLPDVLWYAGGEFLASRGWNTKHWGEDKIDDGALISCFVDYAPTCCMFIGKNVFDLIGVMDEKYFVYSDDADFCYRAKMRGLKLFFDSSISMHHKVSVSTGGNLSDFSSYYMSRNLVYFNKKYFLFWFVYSLLFFQYKFFYKLVLGKIPFKVFLNMQKGFFSGIFL